MVDGLDIIFSSSFLYFFIVHRLLLDAWNNLLNFLLFHFYLFNETPSTTRSCSCGTTVAVISELDLFDDI